VRILRARLDVAMPPGTRSVMVTSAIPNEGKSTTAANLALAYAEAGRDVVLVDLDLGRPSLQGYLRLPEGPGAVDVLDRRVRLADALHEVPLPSVVATNGSSNSSADHSRRDATMGRLRVLTAGTVVGDPVRLLSSSALEDMLGTLADETGLVLVDAAPLLPVSHGVILGSRVDAVLAVARSEALDRAELRDFIETLNALPAHKLGLVLTGVPTVPTYASYYGAAPAVGAADSRRT
jgi:non-specific protein-tyrosine kinase